MYHVSAQGIGERMINVHYYYCVRTCIREGMCVSRVCGRASVAKTFLYIGNLGSITPRKASDHREQ